MCSVDHLRHSWLRRRMRRRTAPLLILALLLATVCGSGGAQASTNLLRNPGFEGEFFAWSGIPEVQVAHEWTPWWVERQESDPLGYNHRPEYKRAVAAVYPDRVHSGDSAQQWFTFYATHVAGMYQQVSGIPAGVRLRFSIWAMSWSSAKDDPRRSETPAEMNLQVGIDPTGNWNPWAGTVVWSGAQNRYDAWGQLSVETAAQGDAVTVFMKSAPNYAVKHNDTYWDEAVLEVVGESPPAPEATQPAATATPAATWLPSGTCNSPPAGWIAYSVRSGDYLSLLAMTHGVSLASVVSANCLEETTIYPGQQLWLPATVITLTATVARTAAPTATATITPTATATPAPSETAAPPPTLTETRPGPGQTGPPPSPTAIRMAAATLPHTPTAAATPAPQPATVTPQPSPAASGGPGGLCGAGLVPIGAAAAALATTRGRSRRRGG